MKVKDGLALLQLVEQQRVQIGEMQAQLERAEEDLQLIASALVKTAEFDEWLMDQDLSCAHQRKPSDDVKRVQVEGATDLTLAVAYAGRAQS